MATAPQFKIERNVALPSAWGVKYPFADLGVGDSFLATGVERNALAVAALNYGKKHGVKLTVRKTESGLRVWRVA